MVTYALDYESYYDKSCSIRRLGPLGYFSHPEFDAYMVSVVGHNGYEFVGHPKEFDWGCLRAREFSPITHLSMRPSTSLG